MTLDPKGLEAAMKAAIPPSKRFDVAATVAAAIRAYLEATAPSEQDPLERVHSDDLAVDKFAEAMKAKLKWEREVRKRGGWDDPAKCSVEYLARLLVEHLGKGNAGTFEDVANFAMMLHQRGADPKVLATALLPATTGSALADHVLIDGGRSYYLSTDAMSTMMAHGLLSSHHDGMIRLATEEALRNDPGSAGVNHNHPRAVLAIVRAALTASPPASGAVEGAPLRYCGYCKSWNSKPCGNGCVWTPDMPTSLPGAPTEGR